MKPTPLRFAFSVFNNCLKDKAFTPHLIMFATEVHAHHDDDGGDDDDDDDDGGGGVEKGLEREDWELIPD